jgi:transcriptional regulator with XRE-family HTH domain
MTMPSDVVAARVREVRGKRNLTVAGLAARCAELGAPELTAQALYKLEQRRPGKLRPRPVTVDELLALAAALNCPPVCLLVPPDDPGEPYAVTAALTEDRFSVRAWIRGAGPLLGDEDHPNKYDDNREYYAELPPGEYFTPGHMTSDGEAWVGPVQQGPPSRRKESENT